MTTSETAPLTSSSLLAKHAALCYFLVTFTVSWLCAFFLVASRLLHGEAIPKFAGLMMFPAMLLGPSASGIFLTWYFNGRVGLRQFLSRLSPSRISLCWLPMFLIPPVFVPVVLIGLTKFLSPAYVPNHFFVGAGFGVVAGFFEELGWTGFALPKMLSQSKSLLPPAILLGVLWACWHIPVLDYLGTATPHGQAWLPFFLAFTAAMTAIRVLIVWTYVNTQSILLAQLLHAFSTASLVVFSPAGISGRQEALWYFVYAAALWLLILSFLAASRFTSNQTRHG